MVANLDSKLEQRIVELLRTTRLTFKQIVNKLQAELSSSVNVGTIRRINRDNRFRRPRYDSKLTREQRARLLDELARQCAGGTMRPNLSQLAKQFGVCHGSIWYWWDKLNKGAVRPSCGSPSLAPSSRSRAAKRAAGVPRRWTGRAEAGQQFDAFQLLGRVEIRLAHGVEGGQLAQLPILMLRRNGPNLAEKQQQEE